MQLQVLGDELIGARIELLETPHLVVSRAHFTKRTACSWYTDLVLKE
jgi:hypothetical protein